MSGIRFVCLLFALFVATSADEHWDYHENGPSTWGRTYETCNGDSQSPILLNSDQAETVPQWVLNSEGIDISLLNYDSIGDAVFSNNGHSVSLAFNYSVHSTAPRVVISKPTYNSTYYLQSLHFHWQSEHWINNRNFPLEMHMVHSSANGETLVIGYVFIICPRRVFPWFTRSNLGLDIVATAVESLTEVGNNVNLPQFAPQLVMPSTKNTRGFFAYSGSLTTPPCTQGVTWLVREEPLCAEDWQLQTFYTVRDSSNLLMAGNARPLQVLNGRSILFFPY